MRLSTDFRPRNAARNVMVVMTLAFVVVLFGVLPAPAQTEVEGNPTCGDLAPGTIEFHKFEPIVAGTSVHSEGPLTVTIVVNAATTAFDWSSNFGIDAVFVKGGPSGLLYSYDEATADTGLHAPDNKEISHISFCFDEGPPPTTAPPTTAPPTTAPPTTAPPTTAPPTTAPPVTQAAPPPPPPGPAAAPPPPAPAARPPAPAAPAPRPPAPAAPPPVAAQPRGVTG
jgi:hypothetical protein